MENSSSGGGANNQPYRVDLAEDLEEAQELGSGAGSNHGNQGESQENGYDDDYGYQGHDGSYHGDSASSLFSGAENPFDLQSTYSRSGQGGFIPAIALSLLTGGRSGGINFGIIFPGGSSHRGSEGERDYYSPYEEESGFHDNVLAIEQTPKKNKNAVRKKKPLEKNKESPEYLANPTECSSVTQSGDGPFMNPGMEQTATTTLENPQTHASVSEQLPVSARGQSGRKTVTDAVDSIEDKVSCTLLSTTATTTMLLTTAAATTATVTTAAATTTIATTAAATTLPLTTVAAAKTAMATTTAMTTTSATTTMLTTTNATTLTKTALTTLKTSATEAETATGLATPIPTKTTPIATLTTKTSTKTTSIATANTKTKATTTTPIATAVATRTTAATTTPKATAAATTKITTIATAAATTKSTPIATAATTTKITPIATIVSAETKKGSSIITSYQESNVNCTDQIKDQLDNQPLPSILSLEDTSGGQLPGNHGTAADLASWEMDDVCMDDAFPDLNFPSRNSLMKTSSAPQLSKRNKNANVSVKKNVFKSAIEHDWTTTESTVLGKMKTLSGVDSQMDGADKRRLSPADGSRMREEKTPSAEKPKRERQQIKNFGRGYRDDPQMQHLEDGQTEQELASYHDSTSSQFGQLMGSSADEGTLKGMLKDEDDQHGLRPFDVEGRLSQCHSGSAGQGHSVSAGQGQTPQQMFGDVETQGMGDRQEWKTRPHTAMVKQLDERTGSRFYEMVSNMKELVASKGLIVKDVYPDGNCLFAAVVDQLRVRAEFYYTARTLRAAAVESLREHPTQDDGTHLKEFLTDGTWEEYLTKMATEGMWGDHMILRSICEVLKRTIVILGGISGLGRTVLEPSSATQTDTESSQEPGPSTDDDDFLYLGHMAESHYVSLRNKDWEDRLHQTLSTKKTSCFLKPGTISTDSQSEGETQSGSQSEGGTQSRSQSEGETQSGSQSEGGTQSDAPPGSSSNASTTEQPLYHLNFLLKIISRGPYFFSHGIPASAACMEGPLCTSYLAGAAVADLDVIVLSLQPLYEDSTSVLNANSRETRSERTVIIECIKTPSDTFVHTEKQKALAERKDLVLCEDDCFVGYAKLRPVTSSLWGQFVTKGEESEPLLKHIPFNQNRQHHQSRTAYSWEVVLGFRCAWPAIAAEWLQRHRPVDWPSAAMMDELVKDTCRVVPVCHPHNRSSSSISQVKLAHSALIPSQRACFHAFKVLLDYTFKGLQPLDMDLLVSVFFYICEEIPHDQWTTHPSWCVLKMVEQLQQGLASHFLPDYFIRAANRFSHLTDDQHVEKYVTVLDSLQKQIVVHVYFMLDDHNFLRSELNMVFDRCLEDCQQLAQHGDLSRCVQECFIECSAELVHGYILGKYYERARTMCVNLFQDLTTLGSSAGNMSLRDLLNAVVRRLPLYLKCCFALYLDHGLKTNILEEICCDRESVPISNLLGVDFGRNVLTTSTDIRIPSELTSPDKVFEFLLEMDFLLVDEMYLGEEWNSCLHHFLREHTPRLLQHVTRGPVRKHAVGFEAITKLKLRILFISLYTRYMHKSELYRLADMMEQIELLCEFYPCFSLLNCLSYLWSSFNDADKAREARMKADSVTIEFM